MGSANNVHLGTDELIVSHLYYFKNRYICLCNFVCVCVYVWRKRTNESCLNIKLVFCRSVSQN